MLDKGKRRRRGVFGLRTAGGSGDGAGEAAAGAGWRGSAALPPHVLFAGDLGQEGKVNKPASPASYVQSVPQPLFPCVHRSVRPRCPQAGWLVGIETPRWGAHRWGGWTGAFGTAFCSSGDPLAWEGGLDFKAGLEGAVPVPTCPRRQGGEQLSPSGHAAVAGMGHIWLGRCGGSARGSPAVVCFHLPLFPSSPRRGSQVTPAPRRLLWSGKQGTRGSPVPYCCGTGVAPQPREGLGSPWPGWSPGQARRSAFLLAIPSCEGGRTIWSPLRQPNKPGNAGQALQIPLTAAGHRAEPATRA